jgi:hypothetical protein
MLDRQRKDVEHTMRLIPRRRTLAAAALAAVALAAGVAGPAHAGSSQQPAVSTGGRYPGECTFTNIAVSFSPSLGNTLRPTTLTFAGSGGCVVDGVLTNGTFTGTLSGGFGLSCNGGTANGTATLDLNGSFPLLSGTASLVLQGPTVSLTMVSLNTVVGVGEFTQPWAALCPLSGTSSTSWAGTLALS